MVCLMCSHFHVGPISYYLATMDSNVSSPTQESNEHKAEFRKITNEAANRKYRRHSPLSGSSDEEG